MNSADKETNENKMIFQQFLRLQGGIFDKDVPPVYGDKPDIIVDLPDKIIDIEITGLVIDAKKELYAIKRKILEKARMHCVDKGVENLSANIIFSNLAALPNPHYRVSSLKKKDRHRIAGQLAEQIKTQTSNLSDEERIEFKPSNIPEIYKVFLHKSSFRSTKEHLWQIDNADFVITSALEKIQDTFKGKEDKISEYFKKCDECWLIIHANRTDPAQRFKPNDEALSHIYETKFKRAFLLERTHGKINELKISPLM